MEIRKEQSGAQPGQVEQRDLEEINALSKGELKAEDVYVFSLRLCDNEVDRDFQRFDREALERENEENLRACQQYGHPYVLIDREYEIDLEKIL